MKLPQKTIKIIIIYHFFEKPVQERGGKKDVEEILNKTIYIPGKTFNYSIKLHL
jgi:hypothetical protein